MFNVGSALHLWSAIEGKILIFTNTDILEKAFLGDRVADVTHFIRNRNRITINGLGLQAYSRKF